MTDTLEPTAPVDELHGSSTGHLARRVRMFRRHEFALVPAIALAMVIGSFVNDAFLTRQNLINVLQQSSELAVLVIAETIVVLAGKFDLSLESIVGLAPMLAAWLILPIATGGSGHGLNPYLGIVVMLVVGAAVGLGNGLLVVRLGLDAFIATLAVLILLRGITIGLSHGQTLYDLPGPLTYVGTESWAGIPISVWLAGALYLFFGLFLRYHSFGRAIYAIGGNERAARAAGIRVERVLITAYVTAGILAAVAGLMLTGRLASVTSGQGENMIFSVFAAAVIGGISLAGGRGSVFGALTGVLLLGIIANILTLSQIESFWVNASYGAIILIALILTRLTGGATARN